MASNSLDHLRVSRLSDLGTCSRLLHSHLSLTDIRTFESTHNSYSWMRSADVREILYSCLAVATPFHCVLLCGGLVGATLATMVLHGTGPLRR